MSLKEFSGCSWEPKAPRRRPSKQPSTRLSEGLGFVDGQTTNPSLIAKNPEIQQLIASGHTLSSEEEKNEYRKIVQSISPLVGDAGVSIEVFADLNTTAEEMLAQGQEMF
jgi:transaldolase